MATDRESIWLAQADVRLDELMAQSRAHYGTRGAQLRVDQTAARYFGVTNLCYEPSHETGVHRHGAVRYYRPAL
jgi:hypothetical protein